MAVYKNDANLQGLWLLEEASGQRADYTPNANHLTDNNTVGSSADCQEGSKSADFEKNNDESLSIADGDQTGLDITGDLSIVLWIKPESLTGDHALVSKYTWSSNDRSYLVVIMDVGGSDYRVHCQLDANGSGVDATAIGGTGLSAGTWYHIGAVYNGTDIRIYLDGSLDSNGGNNPKAYAGGIYNGAADFRLGRTDDSYPYDGLMDEVGVFDRALSAAEVADIEANGIQTPTGAGLPVLSGGEVHGLVFGGVTVR